MNPSVAAIVPGESKGRARGSHRSEGEMSLCPSVVLPDEIESLVQNRFQNNGAHAWLGIVLSMFDGVRIPNLIICGATNLRKQMDLAFLRKMSSKVLSDCRRPRFARNGLLCAVRCRSRPERCQAWNRHSRRRGFSYGFAHAELQRRQHGRRHADTAAEVCTASSSPRTVKVFDST